MRSTIRRLVAASAAVAALALSAVLALPPVTAQAKPAPQQKVAICHATHSDSNPYVSESPNINSIFKKKGHASHTGPIWNATLKPQHLAWGDIIPPFDYTDNGETQHFDGLNWTPEGRKILQNDCKVPATVTEVPLQAPVVTQAACVAGVVSAPSLRLPADSDALTYGVDPAGPYAGGQQVVVTATLADPAASEFVAPLPAGWTDGSAAGTAAWAVTFDADPPCDPPVQVTEVSPAAPVVTQSACVAGVLSAPSLGLPADSDVLTYGVDPAGPYAGGQQVVVTATLADPAASEFVAPLPAGWTDGSAAGTATWAVTFDADPPCDPPVQVTDVPNTDPTTVQTASPATVEPDSSFDYGVSAEPVVRARAHTDRALAVAASHHTGLASTGIPVLPLIGTGAGLALVGAGTLLVILLIERRRRA